MRKQKTISISEEQEIFVKENCINLSWVAQAKLKELMNKSKEVKAQQ